MIKTLLIAVLLQTVTTVLAQDVVVSMTTSKDSVRICIEWMGDGIISANGKELTNDYLVYNYITAGDSGLVELVATGDARIIALNSAINSLSALDVTKCAALEFLNCYYNFITALDVTKCPSLEYLSCADNGKLHDRKTYRKNEERNS